MVDGMAEWQKEWQNGRMAGMATYVLFMVHTDDTNTDTNTTLIFYSIDSLQPNANPKLNANPRTHITRPPTHPKTLNDHPPLEQCR